jgi:hypothetical protein
MPLDPCQNSQYPLWPKGFIFTFIIFGTALNRAIQIEILGTALNRAIQIEILGTALNRAIQI